MLVLIDENLPQKLRLSLTGHDVRTVGYEGWAGLVNGALLRAAEVAGFEVLLTADQSIRYQRNPKRKLALVVLSTNRRILVMAHVERIAAAIDEAVAGSVNFVEIGF